MNLKSTIEAILFVSDRPMTKKELAKITKTSAQEVETSLVELKDDIEKNNRGLVLLINEEKVQFSTSPEVSSVIKEFLDVEVKEELTPASLETLSIISYRGPILREDLDNIRGVNCSVILRHLRVKGLIEEKNDNGKIFYNLSFDFLRWLGMENEKKLPDYDKFHNLEINIPDETTVSSEDLTQELPTMPVN